MMFFAMLKMMLLVSLAMMRCLLLCARRHTSLKKEATKKIFFGGYNKDSNSHGGIVLNDRCYFSSKRNETQSYSPYETDINISMSVVISNVFSLLKLSML